MSTNQTPQRKDAIVEVTGVFTEPDPQGEVIAALCEHIAREAHEGAKRLNGEDYIVHPEAMVSMTNDPKAQALRWIHDVLEDTDVTVEELLHLGVPKDIVEDAVVITKLAGEEYAAYILRVATTGSIRALEAKLSDLAHNLSTLPASYKDRRGKYQLAEIVISDYRNRRLKGS
jgi:(p)ppGpp synthase/HD superfamily hydrolase